MASIAGLCLLIGAGGGVLAVSQFAGGEPAETAVSARGGPGGGNARGGGRGGWGAYAPAVAMAEAKEARIDKVIDVLGETRARQSVTLTAEATGLVEVVNIAPGQRVEAGDVLVRIEDDAQAIALARAEAQFPVAKKNAERYRELVADDAASALEAEDAFNAYKIAEADLAEAKFALAQRRVVAPFSGVVGLTAIEPGDYVSAGDVVATLDDTGAAIVEFAVPQESASFVAIGQGVEARLASGAGARMQGEITAIDSRVDAATRTLRVEAAIDNSSGRLLPGAVVAVSTTAKGEPAVSVPGLAVQWDRAGAYVWKRGEDGSAQRASVSIVQRRDDIVLVEGELAPGDMIASEGADRVRAGLPLPGADGEAPRGRRPRSSGGAGVGAAAQ